MLLVRHHMRTCSPWTVGYVGALERLPKGWDSSRQITRSTTVLPRQSSGRCHVRSGGSLQQFWCTVSQATCVVYGIGTSSLCLMTIGDHTHARLRWNRWCCLTLG